MRAFAPRYKLSREDMEDIRSEAYLRMHGKEIKARISYAFDVVWSIMVDYHQKRARTFETVDRAVEPMDEVDDTLDTMAAIEGLPADQREIVILSACGYSDSEGSALLGIKYSTYKKKLMQARLGLRGTKRTESCLE